jgi:hypothetical protein
MALAHLDKMLGELFGGKKPSHWVTRERPKIDRIACPWLILRFIDEDAIFHFVRAEEVVSTARRLGAEPFDIPGVRFSHRGELCSFDAFIADFGLQDEALDVVANVVRGADTGRLDLAPECAGLLALSLGLSQRFADDQAMLRAGLPVYDALYAWARHARGETHGWPPAA